jgi:hypothetical protein
MPVLAAQAERPLLDGEATFAGIGGKEEDAPKAVIGSTLIKRLRPN